jgi:hypothetical protein
MDRNWPRHLLAKNVAVGLQADGRISEMKRIAVIAAISLIAYARSAEAQTVAALPMDVQVMPSLDQLPTGVTPVLPIGPF